MNKYRTRFDIVADILTICLSAPCELNRLFYSISVSYSRLKEITNMMIESGLIEKQEYGFVTTEKGHRFLALYSEIYSMIGQQVKRRTLDNRILSEAKEYAYSLKQKDRENGLLLLEGKSRKILDATSYYLVAKRNGIKMSLAELARLFHVSSNSLSRMKRLIQQLEAHSEEIRTESE